MIEEGGIAMPTSRQSDAARQGPGPARVAVPRRRPGLLGLLGVAAAVAVCVLGNGLEAGIAERVARQAAALQATQAGAHPVPEITAELARLEETRARLAAGIRGVTLLIAGLGFAFGGGGLLMHLSGRVARRRREFGLRLGAGAPRAELLWEVLAEAAGAALAGGLLGLLTGRLGALALASLTDWPARPPLPPALGALAFALALGLALGLYPAWRAMRQTPITPLRPVPPPKPRSR
jgi:ABC-type lipoprotein release transport system permease subunit